NYFSSLASVSLLLFLPAMIGLSLGLFLSRGWPMLLLLPMLASFLLMVTALTYQFQGWLATLMANPRRRRTIIVLTTMFFVLLSQMPNLVNALQPWKKQPKQGPPSHLFQQQDNLLRDLSTGKITAVEYRKRQDELTQAEHDHKARIQREEEERIRQWERTA